MKKEKKYLTALTIAGSDSGGGAGIQADLKTFSSLGVYGTSVITAITAQNTREVRAVDVLSPNIVALQMQSVLDDIGADAVKTGMLPTPEIVEVVARLADTYRVPHLVVDPVMVSTSGSKLAEGDIISAFRELLYPRLTLITPNLFEASKLSGIDIRQPDDAAHAAEVLMGQGCHAVLIKGGHMAGHYATDILYTRQSPPVSYTAPFVETVNLHGTGCTLSSAITAFLAQGYDLPEAVGHAKNYISGAILAGKDVRVGGGHGPLNHFYDPKPLKPK